VKVGTRTKRGGDFRNGRPEKRRKEKAGGEKRKARAEGFNMFWVQKVAIAVIFTEVAAKEEGSWRVLS